MTGGKKRKEKRRSQASIELGEKDRNLSYPPGGGGGREIEKGSATEILGRSGTTFLEDEVSMRGKEGKNN